MSSVSNFGIGGVDGGANPPISFKQRKEIYRYEAPFNLFAMDWSVRLDKPFRLGVCSCAENFYNKVQIISLDSDTEEFSVLTTIPHPYPPTKLMFIPDSRCLFPDLFATTGDYLRIYRMEGTRPHLQRILNNNRALDYCAPLTSFDWNEIDPTIIGTSGVDTTCTIWNIETAQKIGGATTVTGKVNTRLIAHDSDVLDISFCRGSSGKDVFITAGSDGSVRLFDLRQLAHSTVLYEYPDLLPAIRAKWNKHDSNYIATFGHDSNEVLIIDVRMAVDVCHRLISHTGPLNDFAWAPHTAFHIATAADDRQALIWDRQTLSGVYIDPFLAYNANGEINQIQWPSLHPEWVAICYATVLELLRV